MAVPIRLVAADAGFFLPVAAVEAIMSQYTAGCRVREEDAEAVL